MKKTKNSLLHSVIALLLCISMLIGTTFAWFSDKISSGKNIITAGNLDLEMYWTDDLNSGKWYNVEKDGHNTIFNYDNWEPGYTDVKYIKLVNAGKLALNYKLSLTPENGVGKLAEVINVYYAEGGVELKERSDLQKMRAIGLLNNILNGGATADGTLLAEDQYSPLHPSGEVIMTVALNMLTTAGNEYQNEDSGKFTITALATQAPFEEDSFGSDYDANAEYPAMLKSDSAVVPVTPVNGKVPAGGVTLSGSNISAFVPEGTEMEAGADKLTLKVTPLEKTTSDIIVVNNEILIPVDVHIYGVAENNTVPIIVNLGEILPKYLNMGNYHLYHVEDGTNSVMKLVADASGLTAHNTFTYAPLTGAVSVAMATFSEVTAVADTAAKWEGGEDYSWYNTTDTELKIANADQLHAFAKIVGGMAINVKVNNETKTLNADSFLGKTVKLLSDINLNNGTVLPKEEKNTTKTIFYPIGYNNNMNFTSGGEKNRPAEKITGVVSGVNSFGGIFDGNGHKIANFYQNTWEMFGDYNSGYPENSNYYKDAMGLFAWVDGTVKNLTVDNFQSDGEFTPTGVISAYAGYDGDANFENIAITNCNPRVYNTGNGGIVGIGGNENEENKITFKNITVDNSNTITALWGSWDVACGGLMGMFRGKDSKTTVVTMTNCHVAAKMDVYNDVCGNYQYYWYRYSGMLIGTNFNMTTDENGYTVPRTEQYEAEGCTVHFGDWNDYYYCELVANSLASYTHDHQFSRLEQIQNVSEIQDDEGNWNRTGNFILMTGKTPTETCCHIVNKNGDFIEHTHGNAGYENNIDEDKDGEIDLKEDKQRVFLPFTQLFTGYGWGVKHIPLGEFEGVTILPRNADSTEKFKTKFTGDFLYRVGNQNAVSIGSLFAALTKDKDGKDITINNSGVWVTVEKVDKSMTVGGTFTANKDNWESGTIQFSGTGVVKVTIQDYNFCVPTVLYLEVVDAKNITSAASSNGTSVVLLQDVEVSSNGNANYTNCTVYGNGFTFDVCGGMNQYNSKQGHGIIIIKNATLDHLRIEGDVYDEYGMYTTNLLGAAQNDYTGAVDATNSTIQNCYIANCAAPIRSNGNKIIDTTLYGGTIANLLISGGTNILTNVTTINYNDGRDVIGMGIVITDGASADTTKLILNGNLKQYNYVAETDVNDIKIDNAKSIFNSMFGTEFEKYHIGSNPKTVNTGIVSINEAIALSDVLEDNANTGYVVTDGIKMQVSAQGTSKEVTASVATVPSSGTVNNGYDANNDARVQGDYLPIFKFELGSQMQSKDNDDDTRYLIGDVNGLTAMYPKGENALILDLTKLATVSKYEGISYSVAARCVGPNGEEKTGTVTLDTKGTYKLIFTVNDNLFFDKDGKAIAKAVERIYEVPLVLDIYEKSIADATMTIGSSNLVGEYISSGTNKKYKMYPLKAITSIMDDANKDGVLETFDFKSNIQSAILTPVSNNAFSSPTTITVTYEGGQVLTIVLGTPTGLNSPGASNGGKTFSVTIDSTNGIYLQSDGAVASSSAVAGTWPLTSWSFKGTSGKVINDSTKVTIDFTKPSGGSSPCVTPDTLVTLIDGTQKRIDEVSYTDKLLVWNFYEGKYDFAPVAIIFDHGADNNTVIDLTFSDGTKVKVVNMHQFYDDDVRKFITINEETVANYLGHRFAKHVDGETEFVELTSYSISKEYVEAWGIMTAGHYNIITADMVSADFDLKDVELFNYFEVGEDMKYDAEQMQADIEKYGLYTYADFADYLTYEQFVAFNVQYFKIPVVKGLYTYNGILELIEQYLN